MKICYSSNAPDIVRDESGSAREIHHNHDQLIDYKDYKNDPNTRRLRQKIDESVIAVRGCIAFFQVVAGDKDAGVLYRAAAASAVGEDLARLENYLEHRPELI